MIVILALSFPCRREGSTCANNYQWPAKKTRPTEPINEINTMKNSMLRQMLLMIFSF
jgi:hypothetical protein